ncbi:MAG: hypothetical protein K2X00_22630 [Nitrospiraceae bacterium]|nr:hypothetical protein [Nitrospiraceae bacterium]
MALIGQKCDGTLVGMIERIYRTIETDAQASKAPVRDASQFVIPLFAKG